MKNKFEIGQQVFSFLDENCKFTNKCTYINYNYNIKSGKIIKLLKNNKVIVLWDNDYLNDHDSKGVAIGTEISSKLLFSTQEIKEKFNDLEKEFSLVANQVYKKIKEAGKLIKEANSLAKKTGVKSLFEMNKIIIPKKEYHIIDLLISAMDYCGWNSSSLYC